ncbi:integron integrase [Candidatus Desantisbacteria bacterium]|nr:integron integrase [Candidatus Desantisbacteria bacterium]
MREAIRLKHYSYSTEKTYIDWAQRFYNYVLNEKKKNISELNFDENDLKDFLTYLAITRRVASSTQNQAFNALLFLFKNILNISVNNLGETVRAKRGPKLPVVLSTQEVQKVFAGSSGTRLLILKLIYGAGLRLMDLLRLRVKDIDFDYNTIFIRGGKGDKDRTTMLPQKIREDLIKHIEKVKALHEDDLNKGFGEVSLPNALDIKYPNAPKELGWQYVFPSANLSVDPRSGKIKRHHLNEKTVQNAMKNAVKKAGIIKHATVHTLRHSFATHMLMNGVNIIEIQDLLGHKNVETTMIYTHVMRDMSNAPKSPLDLLK